MQFLLITLMVAIISAQNILRKRYNQKTGGKGTYLFLGILSLTASLFFLAASGFKLTILPTVFLYAVGIAIAYSAANYFAFKALFIGPLSLSSLIGAFSLIVPTTFGILFYKEAVTPWYLVGSVFLVLSIFLTNSTKKDGRKFSVKWLIFSVLGALTNGLFSVIQSLQQRAFDGLYKNELMFIGLILSSAFFFLMSYLKERDQLKSCIKEAWIAAVVGASSGIGNLCKMVLMSLMNLSLIFPFINAGGIIVTSAAAILFYKEKLTLRQYLGVVCGIITIIFIGL